MSLGQAIKPEHISRESPLMLGSGSPRRRDILSGLGIPLRVEAPNVPEDQQPGDTPERFLERVVADKLRAAVSLPAAAGSAVVLVADTIVVSQGKILGKPRDLHHAVALLGQIAGCTHTVMTRYALCSPQEQDRSRHGRARTVSTLVTMRAASDTELQAYAATGEGLDKAGAYAAQGVGAFLIQSIQGSYSNVVGLPACEVIQDLLHGGWLRAFPKTGLASSEPVGGS